METGNVVRALTTILAFGLLVGCSGEKNKDLQVFMEKAKNQPVGEIEPLPTFRPYQTFRYSAIALRSPFDKPLSAIAKEDSSGRLAVEPDENRKKEYLEGFNFSSFSLVGVLDQGDTTWSLVDDGEGGVHRITVGNFLGKNHGKITGVSDTRMEVLEIVPDGKGGWVERPRTLALKGSN
ncbi:MAG: pilus assembly protein PilP [Gammaproteobacteria bacterium]|nr:pilus assembly protein PilP [Gammaproteobacteria bacterium]